MKQKQAHIRTLSTLGLFVAALIWGSSFIVVKNTVDVFPPNILLAFRFSMGAVLLALVFLPRWKNYRRGTIFSGIAMGTLLFIAYSLQTIGITDTTPGKNAFLTSAYCVIVPFFSWIATRRRPDGYNFASALICITGIGLVCLTQGLTIGFGDSLTLLCGIFYAAHIVVSNIVSKDRDPILLTIVQFFTAAVLSWVVGLSFEPFPAHIPTEAWAGLLFLGIFATTVALLLQTVGLKYTPPSSASIILSLEAVFGVLFSVFAGEEQITGQLLAGFALIFIAVLISETKLSFLRKNDRNKKD